MITKIIKHSEIYESIFENPLAVAFTCSRKLCRSSLAREKFFLLATTA